jgi:hypothetical protein
MDASYQSDEERDDDVLYPDDLLSRMFCLTHRTSTDERSESAVEATACEEQSEHVDFEHSLFGRMFEGASDALDETLHATMTDGPVDHTADHIIARMFDMPDRASTSPERAVEDDHYEEATSGEPNSSAVPTMSILETRNDALDGMPLSSRMFESDVADERSKINQYEFQTVIREIVSVRHSIRDHVIQLRQLRVLHRKYEETLHAMLQMVKQDGVRSCDYPLLFYMSRRTKRRVNKHVHQSEQLQTFMQSRGIHMSDVERKDLISLIKKESYIKNTEGTIRSVPIDNR